MRLAVDGRSNREIAHELYVTLKTVEGHLSRAYTKLGIEGRGQLPRVLEEKKPGCPPSSERPTSARSFGRSQRLEVLMTRTVREAFERGTATFNAGDIDGFAEVLADDVVFEAPGGLRGTAKLLASSFSAVGSGVP